MVSQLSSDAYHAARSGAAVLDRSDRGRFLVRGGDRRSFLQGLLTNDIAALGAGQGCYAAYLTAQGRMIADLFVYELSDALLVTTVGAVKDLVLGRFDEFVFTEDVQLTDLTATHAQIAIVGPAAAGVLAPLAEVEPAMLDGLPHHACRRLTFSDQPVIVTRTSDVGVSGFDVYLDIGLAPALVERVTGAGAAVLTAAEAEVLRVEAGIPLFGRDMDDETIPLEAGIEDRAISFSKGCYVGQEVIVRVLHRGHGRVARKLVGIRLNAQEVPATGASVEVDGGHAGRVTSSIWSPTLQAPLVLAYVPREKAMSGTPVSIAGERGVVTQLPVVAAA